MRFNKKDGHRSGFEYDTTQLLNKAKVVYDYEPKDRKLAYTKPETNHKYLPDYILANGIHIECKGRWTAADRKKCLFVKACNPSVDLRIVFQQPNNKINKSSKTTYKMWADKNNIIWGVQADILKWAKEPCKNIASH